MTDRGKPLYMIGVVAEMLKLHPQTLRIYEKKGLIRPEPHGGADAHVLRRRTSRRSRASLRLARDLGVNLAGVEIILKMRRRMLDMQAQIEELIEPRARRYGATRRRRGDRGKTRGAGRAASSQLSPVDLF